MKHSPPRAAPALIFAALLSATGVAAAPGEDGSAADPRAEVRVPANPAPGPAAESATRPAPTLEGRSWLPAAYYSGTASVEIAAGPRPARFRFEAGRLAGSVGCNQLGGAYTLAGEQLTFKPTLLSTMVACTEPLMKQEQAVGLALTRVAAWRLDGELLEFLDAAGLPLLRLLPLQPAPLVGPVWQLAGYNNGKQAIVSALNGTEISLEFRDDGTLGGADGCNRYLSGYTLTGETLAIGPLASTRMACRGPDGAAQQARDYAAALGTVAGYRIDGGELTLLTAAGKPAARYRAAPIRPAAAGSAVPQNRAPAAPPPALPPAAAGPAPAAPRPTPAPGP